MKQKKGHTSRTGMAMVAVTTLALSCVSALLYSADPKPKTSREPRQVGGEPDSIVQVANLVYAGSKSSHCFSDHFLAAAEKETLTNDGVIDLIKEKLPVSISLGLWTTLISYLISIPLGIRKAVQDGSRFDMWTSTIIIIGYALPGFLVAILLIILFAGGSYFDWFPLRGLTSDNWATLSWWQKILDYFWHLVLPISAMMLSAFATLTLLTKNSFLDEIRKQYVLTARAKGCTSRQTLYGHVFRNAMLIVIAGFPSAFVHAFFAGSLLIETIFNLDGLGLLSFESVLNRDYPVVFANLYIFALIGLIVNLISDLTYTWVDPRIDFETREV